MHAVRVRELLAIGDLVRQEVASTPTDLTFPLVRAV
jgi:hypothetical protein